MICLRLTYVSDDPLCFRLIQWNPSPAPAISPAQPGDSSESSNYSLVPYGEEDALRFKAERDESRRELGEVSKKACVAEIEWEDQRKQLLATINGIFLKLPPNLIRFLILTAIVFATLQPVTLSLTS
jgi:hypothetical protein